MKASHGLEGLETEGVGIRGLGFGFIGFREGVGCGFGFLALGGLGTYGLGSMWFLGYIGFYSLFQGD